MGVQVEPEYALVSFHDERLHFLSWWDAKSGLARSSDKLGLCDLQTGVFSDTHACLP